MVEEAAHESYKVAKKAAKKEVEKVQEAHRKMFGERLDSEEGQRAVFRIAKQIARERFDVTGDKSLWTQMELKEDGRDIWKGC